MKIKFDFVTNSSSTSYIIGCPKGFTSEILEVIGYVLSPDDYDGDPEKFDPALDWYELSMPYDSGDIMEKIIPYLEWRGCTVEYNG